MPETDTPHPTLVAEKFIRYGHNRLASWLFIFSNAMMLISLSMDLITIKVAEPSTSTGPMLAIIALGTVLMLFKAKKSASWLRQIFGSEKEWITKTPYLLLAVGCAVYVLLMSGVHVIGMEWLSMSCMFMALWVASFQLSRMNFCLWQQVTTPVSVPEVWVAMEKTVSTLLLGLLVVPLALVSMALLVGTPMLLVLPMMAGAYTTVLIYYGIYWAIVRRRATKQT